MNEETAVREPSPSYITGQTATEEGVVERVQIQFPPYFERFLEERDQRIASELRRLEDAVERNGQDIARLLRELDFRFNALSEAQKALDAKIDRRCAEIQAAMDRRFAEMAAEIDHRFTEVNRRFAEMAAEMDRRFAEMAAEMDRRFGEVDRRSAEMAAGIDRRFAEVDRRFAEMREEQKALRGEMRTHFYWTIGLLFPVVVSVVVMLIRLFLVGVP